MRDTPDLPDTTLQAQIATARARLISLADAHAKGALDADAYEAARRAAERALGDALMSGSDSTGTTNTAPRILARPSTLLVSALFAAVFAVAIGGYAITGSPSLAQLGAPRPVAANSSADASPDTPESRAAGLQQIAAMVDKLAARLKDRPDDAEGWSMLARSYAVLGRFAEAVPAYRRAIELQPKDASLLADYADALAAGNGGKASPDVLVQIDRALAIDPKQPKALAIKGTFAFDRGDFAEASALWQRIVDALPPDSEFRQQVQANIDEARRRGRLAVAPASEPPLAPAATASTADAASGAVSGTVTLAPAFASRVSPTDTVFVFARNADGGRMPLAAYRATVADLPLKFRLDNSMAMAATLKLSSARHVIVGARISKTGNATPQAGDLSGETAAVAPGTSGLTIAIAQEVPAR